MCDNCERGQQVSKGIILVRDVNTLAEELFWVDLEQDGGQSLTQEMNDRGQEFEVVEMAGLA